MKKKMICALVAAGMAASMMLGCAPAQGAEKADVYKRQRMRFL